MYSKGEPSVVETGVKALGMARGGKLKGVAELAGSGALKVRKEYAGLFEGGCEDAEVTSESYRPCGCDCESSAVVSLDGKPRLSPRTGDSGRADMGSGMEIDVPSWSTVR